MSDIETVLRQTTPASLPELDVAALRRRGRRRRTTKRAGAAGFVAVVVLAGFVLPAWLRTPAPIRFVEQPAAWAELDYQAAVARLRETARVKAAVPPAAAGSVREIRVMGTAGRGESDSEGTREWMVPFQLRVREGEGIWHSVYDRYSDRIELGTTVEEVRAILRQMPPADIKEMELRDGDPANQDQGDRAPVESMDEAEQLANHPEAREPMEGKTERPDQAYAFIRLADALREHPVEPATLGRGYGVLATLGERWVSYRGLVEDLAGRRAVAFSAVDPGNNSENWLLFDPDTGRVWGEFTYQLLPDGPQFRGGAVVEYVEVAE